MSVPPAPPTPREEVVDTYFGETIVDPYRRLGDAASQRVAQWTLYENLRKPCSRRYPSARRSRDGSGSYSRSVFWGRRVRPAGGSPRPALLIGAISIPLGLRLFTSAERYAKKTGRLKRSG